MNQRLDIATKLLAGVFSSSQQGLDCFLSSNKEVYCNFALFWADTLMHQELIRPITIPQKEAPHPSTPVLEG